MRGRPRKATADLLLNGSFEKHPDRLQARLNEPVNPNPLGPPPAHFHVKEGQDGWEMARELTGIWKEVSEMAPWLTAADRYTVEDICELRYKSRHRTITPSERNTLKQLGSNCGLDSPGRARLSGSVGAAKPNEFEDPRDRFEAESELRRREKNG